MPLSGYDLGYGIALPLVVALFAMINLRWMLPADVAQRYSPAVAWLTGTLLGYWLLRLGPFVPQLHWHWLPWVMLGTFSIGVVGASRNLMLLDRLLLFLLGGLVAGWLLFPGWDTVWPPREQYFLGWVAYVVALALILNAQSERLAGSTFALVLTLTAVTGGVLLAHSGSLRFAQMLWAAAAACGGLTVAARLDKNSQHLDGFAFPFTLFVSAMMLIGHVNSFSKIPIYSYAFIPLAPCSLLILRGKPQSQGLKGFAFMIGLPVAVLATAVGIAFWYEPFSTGY